MYEVPASLHRCPCRVDTVVIKKKKGSKCFFVFSQEWHRRTILGFLKNSPGNVSWNNIFSRTLKNSNIA